MLKAEYNKQYYHKHKEAINAKKRAEYHANIEENRKINNELCRQWREKNREKLRAYHKIYGKAYYLKNKERIKIKRMLGVDYATTN